MNRLQSKCRLNNHLRPTSIDIQTQNHVRTHAQHARSRKPAPQTHTYARTHTRPHAHTYALTHSRPHALTHSLTHSPTHLLTHTHTHTPAHMHTHSHTRTHARTHTHKHTHTHTHTHTNTHAQSVGSLNQHWRTQVNMHVNMYVLAAT